VATQVRAHYGQWRSHQLARGQGRNPSDETAVEFLGVKRREDLAGGPSPSLSSMISTTWFAPSDSITLPQGTEPTSTKFSIPPSMTV
jgi:hypothetical protein